MSNHKKKKINLLEHFQVVDNNTPVDLIHNKKFKPGNPTKMTPEMSKNSNQTEDEDFLPIIRTANLFPTTPEEPMFPWESKHWQEQITRNNIFLNGPDNTRNNTNTNNTRDNQNIHQNTSFQNQNPFLKTPVRSFANPCISTTTTATSFNITINIDNGNQPALRILQNFCNNLENILGELENNRNPINETKDKLTKKNPAKTSNVSKKAKSSTKAEYNSKNQKNLNIEEGNESEWESDNLSNSNKRKRTLSRLGKEYLSAPKRKSTKSRKSSLKKQIEKSLEKETAKQVLETSKLDESFQNCVVVLDPTVVTKTNEQPESTSKTEKNKIPTLSFRESTSSKNTDVLNNTKDVKQNEENEKPNLTTTRVLRTRAPAVLKPSPKLTPFKKPNSRVPVSKTKAGKRNLLSLPKPSKTTRTNKKVTSSPYRDKMSSSSTTSSCSTINFSPIPKRTARNLNLTELSSKQKKKLYSPYSYRNSSAFLEHCKQIEELNNTEVPATLVKGTKK